MLVWVPVVDVVMVPKVVAEVSTGEKADNNHK